MKIYDKNPEYLLLNKDYLSSVLSQDQEKNRLLKKLENGRSSAIAYWVDIITIGVALASSFATLNVVSKIVLFVCGVILAVLAVISSKNWYVAAKQLKVHRKEDAAQIIIEKVKDNIRYTAILVIALQNKNEKFKILTEKDYFLAHCAMDPKLSAADQKDTIIKYLRASYSISDTDVVSVIPMAEEPTFSIKPVHDKIELNGFIIFQIRLRKKVKQNLANFKGAEWLTIEEMKARPEAMGTNLDVINMLEELRPRLTDSFEDFIGPLHVIWNITKDCEYKCAICATADPDRCELDAQGKMKVLNSICTAKGKIRMLDFAGGDPCCSETSLDTIEAAINSLEADHVSVTTTGNGLRKLSEDDRTKLLTQCEITIDAAHENLSVAEAGAFSRQQEDYCTTNIAQINMFSESLQRLMINIPILDDDLSDEEIDVLVDKVRTIKDQNRSLTVETQLLRLMPVGAFASMAQKEAYLKYNPVECAKKINEKIASLGIPCRYHCSLRILSKLGSCDGGCNMLEKKLGVDCAGNVFACAWGGYLAQKEAGDIKKNPFYLGNLVDTKLINILNGTDKTDQYRSIVKAVNNQQKRDYCGVVSWYNNETIFENYDPLAGES